ncbi:hypothetical protein EDD27_2575 [Nonomuraea polychroma]|uniref:Uncharacterized protein n=1 Tax=Nonomuraea polychroma TaxID=46176 RepID=A0A438M3K3_9ACTN|nr:hypothetical protein [Nonomuraea polychroma]RVX40177.1 hypothetical protein EDD27_2575 [Nonomuraea polychroma]
MLTIPIGQVNGDGADGDLIAQHRACPACDVLLTRASGLFGDRVNLTSDEERDCRG